MRSAELRGAFLGAALLCACRPSEPLPPVVSVEVGGVVAETGPRFLSFSIDSSNIGKVYDFSRPRLRHLAGALSPAYLRIGGTDSDRIFYDLSDSPVTTPPAPYRSVLTRAWWDAACGFAADLGLQILFTLNVGPGPRDPVTRRWVPDQARALIAYTRARGCPVAVWELGNEINGFSGAHGFVLDGREYAADMAIARSLVDAEDPAALLAGPADVYWPLWGEIYPVMPEFLAAGGSLVDVVSWHYYPQQSSKCPITSRPAERDTLLDPANLDEVLVWADQVQALRDVHAPMAQVWLDETGHALCGGEVGLSDRFVSGFWWLDQLGLMALRGQPVVVRQALTGGRYNLVDNVSLEPRPDYFNSLLWKRLMGPRALRVEAPAREKSLRLYAHCTPAGQSKAGAITVLAIQLDPARAARVSFGVAPGSAREVYSLTAPDLTGTEIRLSDLPLTVADDGSPPMISPRVTTDPITLPPLSYAFVVLPDADAAACR